MIKAVAFDIDGTLVNSLGNYLKAYGQVLSLYGFKLSDEKIIEICFGKTEEEICKRLDIPERSVEFREKYFDQVRELIPSLELFPDSLSTLEYLKQHSIKIGLITFGHAWYGAAIIKRFNLKNYVDTIVTFNDVKKPKPDPESVHKFAKNILINEDQILVVGDSKSDMLMGNRAGSKTALYQPKENEKFYDFKRMMEKTKPDFVISSLGEVKKLLN